jgi:hypothetical protein
MLFFSSVNLVIYAERGAFSAVIHYLKDDPINLSDFEVGVVAAGFIFGFMVGSPLFAHLA